MTDPNHWAKIFKQKKGVLYGIKKDFEKGASQQTSYPEDNSGEEAYDQIRNCQ